MWSLCISGKIFRAALALGFAYIILAGTVVDVVAYGIDQYVTVTLPLPFVVSPGDPSYSTESARFSILSHAFSRENAFAALMIVLGLLCAAILVVPLISRYYLSCKRCFDIVISILALSVFSPLLAVSALLIKIDSPGPIFLRQTRVGVNRRRRRAGSSGERRHDCACGLPFTLYKLRTMRHDAEAVTGPVWAKEHDSRITRVGRILRKTHIDEIPQFINVLKGDMCVIGPRPERPLFTGELSTSINGYVKRLDVKPGITGLAQVRYHYAASVEDTRKKLKYDLLYINKMCLLMDIRILFRTLNMVLTTKGAR